MSARPIRHATTAQDANDAEAVAAGREYELAMRRKARAQGMAAQFSRPY